jgi:L-lactate dehydrogenase complex protein LldG
LTRSVKTTTGLLTRGDEGNTRLESPVPNREYKGIEDFAKELVALGEYFIACSPSEVKDKILEILRLRGMDQLLVWDEPFLPGGLLKQLEDAGIRLYRPTWETYEPSGLIRAGLTGVSAGIADTGSLLLSAGPGQALTASLLPEIHIAVLWEKDICENLTQALQPVVIRKAPAAVVITGPSRTADIEMTLTIGVHGPGELHVLCIKK